jgi:hypothetical protein
MAKLPFPDAQPGALRDLLEELHDLHARAGWPSTRDMAKGQRFSHTAVRELFTKAIGVPKLPILFAVVEVLAAAAPRTDVERALDKFDVLWRMLDKGPDDGAVVSDTSAEGPAVAVDAAGHQPDRQALRPGAIPS